MARTMWLSLHGYPKCDFLKSKPLTNDLLALLCNFLHIYVRCVRLVLVIEIRDLCTLAISSVVANPNNQNITE